MLSSLIPSYHLLNDNSIVDSRILRFSVGPEKKVFLVHSGAVLALSPYFEKLIHEEKKEANGLLLVKWNDIEEATFRMFSEFAYTGNYNAPARVAILQENEKASINDSLTPGYLDEHHKFQTLKTIGDWAIFLTLHSVMNDQPRDGQQKPGGVSFLFKKFHDQFPDALEAYKRTSGIYTNSDDLIHHAQMYVLGDRYGISRLKDAALEKMHYALLSMVLDLHAADNVTQVVQYAATHLQGDDGPDGEDRLRCLLREFGACIYDSYLLSRVFRSTLVVAYTVADYREVAKGILKVLARDMI